MTNENSIVDDGSQDADTEGHRFKFGLDDGSHESHADDTEGHGFRGNVDDDSQDDAEGHRFKFGLDDGSQDDAEGHGLPSSAYEREGGSRKAPAEDDTEGHVNWRPVDNEKR